MTPSVWIESATFSDDTSLRFSETDIVVFVGPNNSGKTVTLRDIYTKFADPHRQGVVVKHLVVKRNGTVEELVTWLDRTCRKNTEPGSEPHWSKLETRVSLRQARSS